jgi:hypothetical protein
MRIWLPAALLALAVTAGTAAAAPAVPRYGTVDSGWISLTRSGKAITRIPANAPALFATFVWKRAPSTGLPLVIEWRGPTGHLWAIWKSTTLRTDGPGTRLWTSVARKVFAGKPGLWHVRLRVDGRVRGYLGFTVPR